MKFVLSGRGGEFCKSGSIMVVVFVGVDEGNVGYRRIWNYTIKLIFKMSISVKIRLILKLLIVCNK